MSSYSLFALDAYAFDIPQVLLTVSATYVFRPHGEGTVLKAVLAVALLEFAVLVLALPRNFPLGTRLSASAEYVMPYFTVALLVYWRLFRGQPTALRLAVASVLVGLLIIPVNGVLTFDAPCRIIQDCAL